MFTFRGNTEAAPPPKPLLLFELKKDEKRNETKYTETLCRIKMHANHKIAEGHYNLLQRNEQLVSLLLQAFFLILILWQEFS